MTKYLLTSAIIASCMTFAAHTATAVVTVVTTPTGVFTNPGGSNAGDALTTDAWLRRNVRNNGAVGITNNYPRSGNGSLYFNGPNPLATSSKADAEFYFGDLTGKTLGNLTAWSYDWYRDGSSTADAHDTPVARLIIDADGNVNTTNDQGLLIFEQAYSNGLAAAATNTWVSDDIFNFKGSGNSGILWWAQFGVGNDQNFTRDLDSWIAGNATPGFAVLSANSLVLGLNVGIGSGWAPFTGAVDNITVQFGTAPATTYNFELTNSNGGGDTNPVPEPMTASLALLAGVAISLAASRRRYA